MIITTQEKLDTCKEHLLISIEKEKITKTVDTIANNIKKNYPIKGNRKGRASLDAVKSVARKFILENAKQELLDEAFKDLLYETKWKPFDPPEIKKFELNDYNSCTIDMIVTYVPEFILSKYTGFDFEKPKDMPELSEVVARVKQGLCEQFAESVPFGADDFANDGDTVIINYKGTIDGAGFEGNTGEGQLVTVGDSGLIPGFNDNLVGMRVGEFRDFDSTFEQDSKFEVVAGKTVRFRIELISGSKSQSCAFDEELAKKANLDSLEKLEEFVLNSAKNEIDNTIREQLKFDLFEKLLAENTIELPDWMPLQNAKAFAPTLKQKWEELDEESRQMLIADATRKIKISFMMDRIRELEAEAALSDTESFTMLRNMVHVLPKQLRDGVLARNQNVISYVIREIKDEHTIKWLISKSNIVEKSEQGGNTNG